MIFNIAIIFVGLFLLVVGAELLVRGASGIAKKFHIPEILIGLTIVSIGTSMPELIITVKSAMQNSIDLIVGNAIGSDLCNLLFILGIMAILKPVEIQNETKKFHIPIAFASTVLILVITLLTNSDRIISFGNGVLLIILFISYIIYPILLDRKKIKEEYNKEKNKNKKQKNTFTQIFLIILGLILLKYGGDLVVDTARVIAKEHGLSERIIGLTIVAIGTALPEFVTSIVATISKNADIAVGNLIGSSVLNSFLILGIGALITPIHVSEDFMENLYLLTCSTALIWAFCYIPKKDTITRSKGVILVSIFLIYLVKLLS